MVACAEERRRTRERNLERNELPARDRLHSAEGVLGLVGRAEILVEFAQGYPQPTGCHAVASVTVRALESHHAIASTLFDSDEDVGVVGVLQRHPHLQLHRPREFGVLIHAPGERRCPVPQIESGAARVADTPPQRASGTQVKLCPDRAREWPLVLITNIHYLAGTLADLEPERRGLGHVSTLQISVEELHLRGASGDSVERRPLGPAMCVGEAIR